jgi:hypothetical protein
MTHAYDLVFMGFWFGVGTGFGITLLLGFNFVFFKWIEGGKTGDSP